MFCTKCGKQNSDNNRFCQYCGEKLVIKSEINQKPVSEPAVPKKKMPSGTLKWAVLLLCQVIVIAFLVLLAKVLADEYYSPKYFVSRYFESIVNGHPEEAYEYLSFDGESPFFSKEAFCSKMGAQYNGRLINYKIKLEAGSSTKSVYKVIYRLSGKSGDYTMKVILDHLNKKKFFIFDQWKVSTQNICVSDYVVYVPANATATLDGIQLTGENAAKKYDNERAMDAYTIPQIMTGTHTLEVHKEYYQDLKTSFDIMANTEDEEPEEGQELCYAADPLYLTQDVMKQLGDDAYNKFKSMIQTAANDDFSSVINQCVADTGEQTNAAEQLKRIFPENFKSIHVNDVHLEVEETDDDESQSDADQIAGVKIEASLDYTYPNSWGSYWDSSVSIEAYFYYNLNDENKFIISHIAFFG